jgi:hypothetical protein
LSRRSVARKAATWSIDQETVTKGGLQIADFQIANLKFAFCNLQFLAIFYFAIASKAVDGCPWPVHRVHDSGLSSVWANHLRP